MELYSVKMRASQREAGRERHISGAEKIVPEERLEKVVSQLLERALLGQMLAAGVLMQSGLKFNGALILQVQGDGPVKLAVAEVRSDLGLRATATLQGDAASLGTDPAANLGALVNVGGAGRCAITLDPHNRQPGQQPYQGIVPLSDAQGQALTSLSAALESKLGVNTKCRLPSSAWPNGRPKATTWP